MIKKKTEEANKNDDKKLPNVFHYYNKQRNKK